MNGLIYNEDERLIAWASEIIGFTPRTDVRVIGWQENGSLRAVTLYDNFSECDCNIHIAGDGKPHWFKRQFMIASFMHPFVQWNMRRITGLVPANNTRALKFDKHLGFVEEGYLKNALPDGDLVILGMLRENCIYIPKRYRTWEPTTIETGKGDNHGKG